MGKIFNEYRYALKLLEGGKRNFRYYELSVLAKYFKDQGFSDNKIIEELVCFCKKNDEYYNEEYYCKLINSAKNVANKYGIRKHIDVPITKKEMDCVRSIENVRYQKVLFAMIATAKYNKLSDTKFKKTKRDLEKQEKYKYIFCTNKTFFEIGKIAHVSMCCTEKTEVKMCFHALGFIDATIHNSHIMNIIDTDENSEVEIVIEDMDGLIKYFPHYCSVCGCRLEKKNNKHKMCRNCWMEKKKEFTRNAMKKIRNLM